MAGPALDGPAVARMTAEERWKYFQNFAQYCEDAPPKGPHYHIRIGSRTLYSDDTADLREQFEKYVHNLRRSYQRKRGK
jgi:hypothetical protein